MSSLDDSPESHSNCLKCSLPSRPITFLHLIHYTMHSLHHPSPVLTTYTLTASLPVSRLRLIHTTSTHYSILYSPEKFLEPTSRPLDVPLYRLVLTRDLCIRHIESKIRALPFGSKNPSAIRFILHPSSLYPLSSFCGFLPNNLVTFEGFIFLELGKTLHISLHSLDFQQRPGHHNPYNLRSRTAGHCSQAPDAAS
ncbi:hypothetical protein PGT21_018973 [Puccinia graminis f. sp. tritici]|uniref:Uncharacterized protein n=1 Tax=Puccinia graminis f. sp. tritici TaxID=56615 RepID=A0A5B0RWI6_PUCGR|nr:hypothetical protein PGT21_018973 [Puccinia graminis f. sp. tritici]KAA1130326.1 hypothetical protein PGTUg99_016720 [Puccinia graminis f. sp. tritici]